MRIPHNIVEQPLELCDFVSIPPSEVEEDPSLYSYRLGYRHGECMGRRKGQSAGVVTARRYIDSEPGTLVQPGETARDILRRLLGPDRAKFDELVNQYLLDSYNDFSRDTSIVVRRSFERDQDTARGFAEGYKSAFEPAYIDSFLRTFEFSRDSTPVQIDVYNLAIADARSLAAEVSSQYSDESVLIQSNARALGRQDAIEYGRYVVNSFLSFENVAETSQDRVEKKVSEYLEDGRVHSAVQSYVELLPTSEILRTMKDNLDFSTRRLRERYPDCDDECVRSYTQGFETTYLSELNDQLEADLRREYMSVFSTEYKRSFQDTIVALSDYILIDMEGIVISYDDLVSREDVATLIKEATEMGTRAGAEAGLRAGFYRSLDVFQTNPERYEKADVDAYFIRTLEHPHDDLDQSDVVTKLLKRKYKTAYYAAFKEAYKRGIGLNRDVFIDHLMITYPQISDPLEYFQREYDRVHGRAL